MTEALVRPDSRGRVSLGGIIRDEQYKVTVDDAGRIILEPAVVLTQTEFAILQDEAFWKRVKKAQKQPRHRIELDDL